MPLIISPVVGFLHFEASLCEVNVTAEIPAILSEFDGSGEDVGGGGVGVGVGVGCDGVDIVGVPALSSSRRSMAC